MAGAGYKAFTDGSVLTAADVNTYLNEQSVMVFATAAARTTALPTPSEGMVTYRTDSNVIEYYDGAAWVAMTDVSSTQTLTNKTLTSPVVNGGILIESEERWNIVAAASTGTINIDALTSTLWYYNLAATAVWTLNFRGNSTTTLSSILAVGDSVTIAFAAAQGTTAYRPTGFQIDGSAVTPLWQGGTAPTAGNVSSTDLYVFTILKTAQTPSVTYTVFASQTQFK